MSAVLLGRRLRALRRLKRLTQLELASEVGISVSMLSTIERGVKYPRVDLIKKFARVLNVPLEEFFVLPDSVQERP
ncbi:MAG: helix-turn-helix transcriptional regulator [Firmicutes bacterium]|nr:helix-turn-helix transcriptional regulator [Bacillota bacterium]